MSVDLEYKRIHKMQFIIILKVQN